MHKFNLMFAVTLALLLALPARAQVKVGLVGGVNIADLTGKNLDGAEMDFSSRAVFGTGGVLDATMSKNTGLRFELLYLQKGGEFEATDPDLGTLTVAFKEAYVEMPILLKIDLGSSATRPYLIAGPTIGFNLSSELEFRALGLGVELDIGEATESIEFGLALGGGVSFPAGTDSIFVEARYALGFSDIIKDGTVSLQGEQIPLGADLRTRGIQIMGGVSFPLGSR